MQQFRNILMVDDDTDDQELFSIALQRADKTIKCSFADDGVDALDKLNNPSFIPDMIFLDLNMPGMDGQECMKRIKEKEHLKNIPLYVYSTTSNPETISKTKELGAADYLIKPTNINELASMLSSILQNRYFLICLIFTFLMGSQAVYAQQKNPIQKLKNMSVEALMDIEVTSVSKTSEKLTEAASAIQVITSEDVQRAPANLLPEFLRLAPNLQVTRSGSHDWSVTARGFNGAAIANSSLANKMLVMIDGRTVYNPLFGGVYWDVQHMLPENIDRIEVISGPGGTLWGANAVNGVVNISSKHAKETQGLNLTASAGTFLQNAFSVNYGSKIDSSFYYRVSGQRFKFNSTDYRDSTNADDQWDFTRGAFRMDYSPSEKNQFTLQGDIYGGSEDKGDSTLVSGSNVLGRWSHSFSTTSLLTFQTYMDHTYRNIRTSGLKDITNTFDVEIQHNYLFKKRHQFTWGGGFRLIHSHTQTVNKTFDPEKRDLNLFTLFLQYKIDLDPDRLELTVGKKLQHNYYTGFEFQPSARLAFTPVSNQTIWTSVSRAVRTPSRFDADIRTFNLVPHEKFRAEKVVSYEIGYRLQLIKKISFSIAGYYNKYTDLRSFNLSGNPAFPTIIANDLVADSWGVEFSGNYIISKRWRLRGGYTYLDKKFKVKSSTALPGTEKIEAVDPKSQALIQSIVNLPHNIEFDLLARYAGKLPEQNITRIPVIPSYFNLDARINWTYKFLSFGVIAQNVTSKSHVEFGNKEIPRNYQVKIGLLF